VPGSTEFDTRDTRPANITVRRTNAFSPHDELAEFQSLPWVIFWSVGQIFTQPYGDFHWHLQIEVSNTAPPTPTTIPFSSEPPPTMKSQSYRFSNPDLWRGIWDSDGNRVTAVISTLPSGLLQVSVTERAPGVPDQTIGATDVPISRINHFEMANLRDAMLIRQPERDSHDPKLMFEVRRHGGYEYALSELVGIEHRFRPDFGRIEHDFGIVQNVKPIELGGDYLSLPNDAALEMHQLTAEGHPIGYGLRYTRPTFVPFRVGGVIDAMLYHRLVVN